MHFTFPAATIISLSGGSLIASLVSNEVAKSVGFAYADQASSSGSIRGGAKTQGDECSFVNAFKVQGSLADPGILGCGYGMTCIEDKTSSIGGRCMNLKGEVIEAHRQLTDCTFANGTDGNKCVGDNACTGADESKIGCGSCYGTKSCYQPIGDVTIGENSCHDYVACMYLQGKCIDFSLH
jgi:hypothetical protein